MADDEKLEKTLIDQAIVGLWPKVQQGDTKAIDRMLRLLDRKEKHGKPRSRYTLSRKALAQRRAAAVKTGEHAALPSGRMIGKARQIERAVESGKSVEVDVEFVEVFERAMSDDITALRQLTASQLAALTHLLHGELAQLQEEGLAQQVPILGGDGEPILDEEGEAVLRTVSNPRADAVLRLAKLLGISAEDQRLTPKSQGEGEVADATAEIRRFMVESFRRTEAKRAGKIEP